MADPACPTRLSLAEKSDWPLWAVRNAGDCVALSLAAKLAFPVFTSLKRRVKHPSLFRWECGVPNCNFHLEVEALSSRGGLDWAKTASAETQHAHQPCLTEKQREEYRETARGKLEDAQMELLKAARTEMRALHERYARETEAERADVRTFSVRGEQELPIWDVSKAAGEEKARGLETEMRDAGCLVPGYPAVSTFNGTHPDLNWHIPSPDATSSPLAPTRRAPPRKSKNNPLHPESLTQPVPAADSDSDEDYIIASSAASIPQQQQTKRRAPSPIARSSPAPAHSVDPLNPLVNGATWLTEAAFAEDLAMWAIGEGFEVERDGSRAGGKLHIYRCSLGRGGTKCPWRVAIRREKGEWAFRQDDSTTSKHDHGGRERTKKTAAEGEGAKKDQTKKAVDENAGRNERSSAGSKRSPAPTPPSPVKTEEESVADSDTSPPKKRRVDSATIKVAKGKGRAPPDSTSSVASMPSRPAALHAKKPSTVPSASASRRPPSSASASSARPQKSTSAKDTEVVMLSSDDEEEDVKPRASSVAIKPGTPPSASLSPALPASRRDDAPPEKPPTAELLALLHTLDPGGAWDFAEFFGNKLARGGITKPLALLKAAATSEKRTALMEELADDEKEGCWRRDAFKEALAEKVGG
ncbi:hypothetical protein JCM10213_002433 [Rhodosporidiobolus nylandii]